MRERLTGVPSWAWVGGIVVVSSALRLWMVGGVPAPFIFIDELIYSELAKSLASGDGYAVRDVATTGYSLLYPLLIAPAYALDDLVDAHRAAQSIGAVVMSLAAVPGYLLARRVAGRGLALLVAAGTVLVPSMAYTATITTESLFYPLSLVVALALVRYLERPTWRRLAGVLVALAVAYATRSQALAFVPALVTAPLVLALVRGRSDVLYRFWPLAAVLGGGAAGLTALQTVRGRSLTDLLGAYRIVGEGGYDAGQVLRFWLWHVEELTLYVGVLPIAALGLLILRGRRLPAAVQEHVAVTVAIGVWSTLVVGAFSSRFASDRVQDRYLFFLAPLLLAVLAAWVAIGAPRPRPAAALTAAGSVGLVMVFPFERFIGEPAKSDSLGLIPLWAFHRHLVAGEYWLTAAAVGAALVALLLLVPSRLALVVPVAVVALGVVESRPVWASQQGFKVASAGALFQGIRGVERDWIDAAVPTGQEVVALWTGRADRFTINQSEFFNRRVGRVYHTDQPTPGGLAETRLRLGRDGVYRDPEGRPIRARYALLDQSVVPDGRVIARDAKLGTTLWRLSGALSQTTSVAGIYPGDTWSGPVVTWTRLRCRPGTLRVDLHSDPNLHRVRQVVRATTRDARGLRSESVAFAPTAAATLTIRVAPTADGTCAVRIVPRPTAIPSRVDPASQDDRVLGVHVDVLSYTPGR